MEYTGGCHCGEVRYKVSIEIKEVMQCNCSICSKRGYLLAFTGEKDFTLTSGEKTLTDYQFGKKTIHHLFCSKCGVGSFSRGRMPDGSGAVAINVRCLDDIDIESFPVIKFDGKSL